MNNPVAIAESLESFQPAPPAQAGLQKSVTTDLASTSITPPASTLSSRICEAARALLPGYVFSGSFAGEHELVMKEVEALCKLKEKEWRAAKTGKALIDGPIDGYSTTFLKMLRRVSEDPSEEPYFSGLMRKAWEEARRAPSFLQEELQKVRQEMGAESNTEAEKQIACVKEFRNSGMKPIEWFEEMRGCIPSSLKLELSAWLEDYKKPAGFLYRIGIKNADREKEIIFSRKIENWLDNQQREAAGNIAQARLREKTHNEILQKLKHPGAAVFVGFLCSLERIAGELIQAAGKSRPVEALQSLGKELEEFKMCATQAITALEGAKRLRRQESGDDSQSVSVNHGDFVQLCHAARQAKARRQEAVEALARLEAERESCDSAVVLDRLLVQIREQKNNLPGLETYREQAHKMLGVSASLLAKSLFDQAREEVAAQQGNSGGMDSVIRRVCRKYAGCLPEDIPAAELTVLFETCKKVELMLERACHRAGYMWLKAEAEVLLREYQQKAEANARYLNKGKWKFSDGFYGKANVPVILDMTELKRRAEAGRKSVLFRSQSSGHISEEPWKGCDTMTSYGKIPDSFLFPLLGYSYDEKLTCHVRGESPLASELWLPLPDSTDMAAMKAGLDAFCNQCRVEGILRFDVVPRLINSTGHLNDLSNFSPTTR